jgi:hypothetical protein
MKRKKHPERKNQLLIDEKTLDQGLSTRVPWHFSVP